MSLVTGLALALGIVMLSATALTAFGIFLRNRDAREQERQGRLSHG
ncbi:MAG TPA: hypothetical protein VH278_12735 [Burkholderiaceae bacterium]|jgi:hypothetical protein|nr:hypothetical protein [Burkholderiaceae bacterium]